MTVLDVPKHIVKARQEMVAAVKTRLGPEFFSHSVVLARTPTQRKGSPEEGWKYLVGTGTLVQVNSATGGPRYGVLTCGHVLGAFEQAPEGTQPGSLTLLLATVVRDREGRPQAATIPYLEHSAVVIGAGNEMSTGPDLAWLPLAAEDARALQGNARSRAVFYNLAAGLRTSDELKAHVRAHGGIDQDEYFRSHVSMAVGWNKEIHTRDPARGRIWMNEVVHDSDSALDGWHFADYRISDDRWTEQN